MKEPEKFPKVFLNSIHVINALHILVGAGGYIIYGPRTKDLIIFNLPMGNYIFVVIVFLFSVQLAMTYSMHLFPLVVIAELALEND